MATATLALNAPVTTSANRSLLAVEGVKHLYHKGGASDLVVLEDVDVDLPPGEIVSLLGRSGSGKSTLLRIIAGLMPASAGRVAIDGRAVAGPAPEVAMVFQSFALVTFIASLQPWLERWQARDRWP